MEHCGKKKKLVLTGRRGFFDEGSLRPEICFKVEDGIMLLYTVRRKNVQPGQFAVGAALFDNDEPTKLLWRSEKPLWSQHDQWKNSLAHPIGVVMFNQHIYMYVQVKGLGVHIVLLPSAALLAHIRYHNVSPKLNRHHKNPLIAPSQQNSWEAFTTFNAAALYADDKFHIVYRAQGYDYVSVLGYASSTNGYDINEKLDTPIYHPREQFEFVGEEVIADPSQVAKKFMSGGGYGGCEDPRLTLIDDKVYMTYVAFDGMNPPRVALTSIDLVNFLSKNWQWEKPVLISPPDVVDKNAVIFPEKINGKYVIMHRIFPDILIDFVDSLNFDGTTFLEGAHKIMPRPDKWDSRKIGAGPPPLKTEYGWLLIYQSVGNQDPGRYKIGAMLLDLNDPTQVLYRANNPILSPEAWYENEGFKSGVVYPCGAVIKDGILFVYYGAPIHMFVSQRRRSLSFLRILCVKKR
ncbi:MAG: Beta-1,4-mannooligosaccharide phosphorylase [Microgenomates bacterium OLB23]|nr:MAG: Beta-1,4-mannooligosaccharide phosphorylase [Microgenomates bacterium OLB23]